MKSTTRKPLLALSHTQVMKDILSLLEVRREVFAWKNNTGAMKVGSGAKARYIAFGLKGSPDIIGMTSDGKFFGIEIKVGRDKQSEHQEAFESKCLSLGGRYIVVGDVVSVAKYLDSLELPSYAN